LKYFEIKSCVILKVSDLIYPTNVDNNICEQLNNTINTFLGGKQIHFTQKSSYTIRINAAVVSFNSKEYLRAIKKHVTNTSPGNLQLL
jgi:hypothetical protein